MRTALPPLFALLLTPLAAQTCYEIALQKGQTAYNQGHYAQAAEYWEAGKGCTGASAAKLNTLISKTKDSDGDGVVNGRDRCPNTYAKTKTGCPDRDRDGVADKEDKGPDVRGTKTNQGCPQPAKPYMAPTNPEDMVLVRGGTFIMGDLFGEGESNETQHQVILSDFYLEKMEVTFDDFDAFCTATGREKPSDSGWGRGQRPVINVDWYEAVEYCNWLSQKAKLRPAYTIDKSHQDPNNSNIADSKRWMVTRNWNAKGYRLPTEAEWEYAAREGGKKVRFGNGEDLADPARINFAGLERYKTSYSVVGDYRRRTVEAGSFHSPNALGLQEMSGNVREWCADWYGNYPTATQNNPTGPVSGGTRVFRGGCWANNAEYCRNAYRTSYYWPTNSDNMVGFRVARSF